jgi:hypothetical protein
MRTGLHGSFLRLLPMGHAMTFGNGFLECGGILRFQVLIAGEQVEAFLSEATCEAAQRQAPGAGSLADYYVQHRSMLDEIVRDKVNAGARHPVVVMARDLQMQRTGHLAGLAYGPSGSAVEMNIPVDITYR